jgi:hypothetical protein
MPFDFLDAGMHRHDIVAPQCELTEQASGEVSGIARHSDNGQTPPAEKVADVR